MRDFVPASYASAAASLEPDAVDVWLLPYERACGRRPLRELLGAYLGLPADRILFDSGPHGRPVAPAAAAAGLDFNWSHSGPLALAAVARALPELGIDLEIRRRAPRALKLAQRFYAPEEHHALAGLSPEVLEPAFLRLWTGKEAVLKALGQGLQYGLHRVTFVPEASGIRAGAFHGEASPARAWQLHPLPVDAGFACVAWRGGPRVLRLFRAPLP